MNLFQHILIATDFSPPADRALELSIELARKFDARLTLLHVYLVPQSDYGVVGYYPATDFEAAAQKTFDGAVERAKLLYPSIESRLIEGDASERILAVVEQQQMALVVIGTHGRGWVSRALIGSVADRVVRTCTVPVLTVPALPSPKDAG